MTKHPINLYLKRFAYFVALVALFEGLLLLHGWIGSEHSVEIDAVGIFTIWAAVLTVVFLVFSVMGLLNIDNRIKELNDTKDRLNQMEAEMKEEIRKFKISADEQRRKIVAKAQEEVVKIMDKSAERQNIFDLLTQIALNPDPLYRIRQYTEILKTKSEEDGVNIGFVYCKRAEAYQELEQDNEALSDFEQALKISPDEVDPYLGIGCFYVYRKNDYIKSIEYFEKAAKIKPRLGIVYSNIANSYGKMGDFAKAEKYYKMADDCGVESFEWYYNKALSLGKSGTSDADDVVQERYYKYCLKLNPHFFPASLNLAMIYRDRQEDGKAEYLLSELISKSAYKPDFIQCVIQRGICTLKMNRMAEALNDFRFAYVFAPRNTQVLCNLAWCSLRLGYLADADEYSHVCLELATQEQNEEIINECKCIIKRLQEFSPTQKSE